MLTPFRDLIGDVLFYLLLPFPRYGQSPVGRRISSPHKFYVECYDIKIFLIACEAHSLSLALTPFSITARIIAIFQAPREFRLYTEFRYICYHSLALYRLSLCYISFQRHLQLSHNGECYATAR
jgi:hypothetical protein